MHHYIFLIFEIALTSTFQVKLLSDPHTIALQTHNPKTPRIPSHSKPTPFLAELVTCTGPLDVVAPPTPLTPVGNIAVCVPTTTTSVTPETFVVFPETENTELTATVAPFDSTTSVVPPGRTVADPGNEGNTDVCWLIGIVCPPETTTAVLPPGIIVVCPPTGARFPAEREARGIVCPPDTITAVVPPGSIVV
jgi:hypothetical protein